MWQDEDSHLNDRTKFNNYSFKMNFIAFLAPRIFQYIKINIIGKA